MNEELNPIQNLRALILQALADQKAHEQRGIPEEFIRALDGEG